MYEMYVKRFGDGKNYITVQFGKVKNVYLILLSEKKESGFYFILFLAIILSSLANITLPGQNIDNSPTTLGLKPNFHFKPNFTC